MPFINTGKIDIYYEQQGEGPRTLFIGGTGGDLRKQPNIMASPLPKNLSLLAYDQRGLGQSGKPDAPYTMADYADDAADLMDALGWDNAAVLGVSFGGMVAQELALRHPEKVTRLVLACTSPGGAGGASYPLHELMDKSPEERARHLLPINDTRCTPEWIEGHPEMYEQMLAMAIADPFADEPGHAMGARRQLEARADHNTWDRLGDIICPTIVCAGKYDALAKPETQDNMIRRLPNAGLHFFEGGHLFMLQDPAAFPAMMKFLKD